MMCNKRDIFFKPFIVLGQKPTFRRFLSSSSDRHGKGKPTPVGYLKRAYIYIRSRAKMPTELETCRFYPSDIQGVPLATETGISLIILTPMKILQRNLNRSTFIV